MMDGRITGDDMNEDDLVSGSDFGSPSWYWLSCNLVAGTHCLLLLVFCIAGNKLVFGNHFNIFVYF